MHEGFHIEWWLNMGVVKDSFMSGAGSECESECT